MTFIVKAISTAYNRTIKRGALLSSLNEKGYCPLIAQAKRQFLNVFGENKPIDDLDQYDPFSEAITSSEEAYIRAVMLSRESFSFGDVFFSSKGKGLLYIKIPSTNDELLLRRRKSTPNTEQDFEIGYLGDDLEASCLDGFASLITEILFENGDGIEWKSVQPSNVAFNKLVQGNEVKFYTADTVSDEDVKLAELLERQDVRNIALHVRQFEKVLLEDILKKNKSRPETLSFIEELTQASLFKRQYVVICRQTSNQTNIMESRDAVDKMVEAGIRCSCGNEISSERIEELFSPTPVLRHLLDQSYWTTAKLVYALRRVGIPDDKILLNLREGPEEIDAFVDLDGVLLMFELKDNQFSMGHAYAFGSRVSIYNPDSAVIVSTKGVDPDVIKHFSQIKNMHSKIIYVEKLDQLLPVLEKLVKKSRTQRASHILDSFATVTMSLSNLLGSKIGL